MSESNNENKTSTPENNQSKITPDPKMTSNKSFSGRNVLIILLSLFAGIFLIVASYAAYTFVQLQKPVSEITVTGIATRDIKPNKATITMIYSDSGEDSSLINQKADDVTKKVTEYLITKGVSEDKITTNKSSYPDYQYGPQGELNNDRLIRVESTIEVVFEDLGSDQQKPNQVLQEATKLGITRFSPFTYEVDNTDAICEDLVDDATSDAFEKGSKRIKNIGGINIVKRQIISVDQCNNNSRFPIAFSTDSSIGRAEDNVAPKLLTGEQKLESRVEVKFEYR